MLKKNIQIPKILTVQKKHGILKLLNKDKSIEILLPKTLIITQNSDLLNLKSSNKSILNTINSKILQSIKGLTIGFKKIVSLHGIGYKFFFDKKKNEIILKLGYSHSITMSVFKDINIFVIKNDIVISGHNQDSVTQFISNLKKLKRSNDYQLKGFHIKGDNFIKKEGKKK